jgi:hypothetical protein
MAGLGPAIYVLFCASLKTWMPGIKFTAGPANCRTRLAGHDDFCFVAITLAQRSTHMAMPMPPPMQSVARPFLELRLPISCSNVTRTRAPDAPIG